MDKESIATELVEKKTYTRLFWDVMNYQLFEVDSHPFTLSKIAFGVFLLIVSYWFSKRAANAVERRLLKPLQVEESLRYAMNRFSFYIFLIITWLFTLHVLNVPITVFAMIGSAVALGIGLGSQNLIYNFISGLLVMVERPIRPGDYIEVDALKGTVEQIGIRATQLLTPSNARVIVPNKVFLENAVTNWTLGDELQSATVRIGVAYGSDVSNVEQLCLQAAREVPSILTDRPVSFMFSEFGDNALLFDVGFWCLAATTGVRKTIESSFRFQLHKIFTGNGVSMPYPTRDLRLATTTPIEVRLSPKGPNQPSIDV